MQGVVLKSVEMAKSFMERTVTNTGLKVVVHCLDKIYVTKRKVADGFKRSMRIVFDKVMPQWNYAAKGRTPLSLRDISPTKPKCVTDAKNQKRCELLYSTATVPP
jgi:hypothetical protein